LEQLSSKLQQQIEWRRNQVLGLSSKGHTGTEIAKILQVERSLVSRDMIFLRQRAQENLKMHVQQKLPEEYQRCLTGMNQVLKLSWQIANNNNNGKQNGQNHNENDDNTLTIGDDRTRLQALSLINDCYKYIMDLTTNGVVITDAIKFVQTNEEKLTTTKSKESRESEEPDYIEDQDQPEELKEKQQTKPFDSDIGFILSES
jgi:hypothetical protein